MSVFGWVRKRKEREELLAVLRSAQVCEHVQVQGVALGATQEGAAAALPWGGGSLLLPHNAPHQLRLCAPSHHFMHATPPHARNTTLCTQDAALDALQERVDAEILGRGSLLGLLAYNFVVPICSDVEFLLVGGTCSCCLSCPSPLLLLQGVQGRVLRSVLRL